MRAGMLRHRVTFQTKGGSAGAYGEPASTWSALAGVWARVEPLGGAEQFDAAQERVAIKTKITTRRIDTLASTTPFPEKMRILWGTRVYNIEALLNDKSDRFEWICTEEKQALAA